MSLSKAPSLNSVEWDWSRQSQSEGVGGGGGGVGVDRGQSLIRSCEI